MVTKSKTANKKNDAELADAIHDAALQIWHAGLGAFAKAQTEGSEAFSKLVKDGAALQHRTRNLARSGVSEVTGSVTKIAGNVGKQAAGSWDKLEKRLESGVAHALHRVGVPVRHDLDALITRIEHLSMAIEKFTATRPAVSKPAPARASKAAKAPAKRVSRAAVKTVTKPPAKAVAKKVAKPAARRV